MTGATVPAGSLDLLVIDEAGQFSLANTLAVAQASSRLLLLGDPQQLPQVSQGSAPRARRRVGPGLDFRRSRHAAARTWLLPGRLVADDLRAVPGRLGAVLRGPAALGPGRGPAAAGGCSRRDRDGHGASTAATRRRRPRRLPRSSGRCAGIWDFPGTPQTEPRPLDAADILVVAAYNAQVNVIRDALDAAGLAGVRVGTVDKFQGQEAAVVIVSMACSAVAEAPRGMEFLLSRNRINVAVSRGQWRAVIVRAPELTNYLPAHPEGLEQLGGFIGLCQTVSAAPSRASGTCPFFVPAPSDEGHAHSSAPAPRDMLILRPAVGHAHSWPRHSRDMPICPRPGRTCPSSRRTPRDMLILRRPREGHAHSSLLRPAGHVQSRTATAGHVHSSRPPRDMSILRQPQPRDMSILRPAHGTGHMLILSTLGHPTGHAQSGDQGMHWPCPARAGPGLDMSRGGGVRRGEAFGQHERLIEHRAEIRRVVCEPAQEQAGDALERRAAVPVWPIRRK